MSVVCRVTGMSVHGLCLALAVHALVEASARRHLPSKLNWHGGTGELLSRIAEISISFFSSLSWLSSRLCEWVARPRKRLVLESGITTKDSKDTKKSDFPSMP